MQRSYESLIYGVTVWIKPCYICRNRDTCYAIRAGEDGPVIAYICPSCTNAFGTLEGLLWALINTQAIDLVNLEPAYPELLALV